MRMSMSCTCANLIYSLKLWSGNMYVLFHLEMWCTELWFCTLCLNYDRAYMFLLCRMLTVLNLYEHFVLSFHIVYWVQNMMLMKINLKVCSWIFIFSKLLIVWSSIPPILKRPTPQPWITFSCQKCIQCTHNECDYPFLSSESL